MGLRGAAMTENHTQALLAVPLATCAADICGKLPAATRPQAALPGFPTATAALDDLRSAELSGAEPSSGSGAVASPWPQGHDGTTPAQAVAEALGPFLQNGFDVGLPEVFSSPQVQAAALDVLQAVQKPRKVYQFELTECELLNAYSAVEQDRNRTYKEIRKGLAVPEDLKGSESLWRKLQAVYFARAKGGAA